jgi:GGDEF domain-containing protein
MNVLPGVCGFAALVLLVVDHFVGLNPLALRLATGSILVMLVRLYLAVHDNARMLGHSRVEASTDALTDLGNRRQLSTDLDAHLDHLDPAQPLMLTIFDLDGFKQYNDRFGHPVGDLLLQRLGARL